MVMVKIPLTCLTAYFILPVSRSPIQADSLLPLREADI